MSAPGAVLESFQKVREHMATAGRAVTRGLDHSAELPPEEATEVYAVLATLEQRVLEAQRAVDSAERMARARLGVAAGSLEGDPRG